MVCASGGSSPLPNITKTTSNTGSITTSNVPTAMQSQPLAVITSHQNNSNIQLTPEMLVFDFQILHPLTLTTIFQL